MISAVSGLVATSVLALAEVRTDVATLVHVVMDGVELAPCADGDIHAARRCTSLVPAATVFPAWGTPGEREAALQALRDVYADFDVTFVDQAPLPFVPHMLAVVGGTSSLIGQETTSCGTASIVCGGQRRDLVSLTFAHSCGGWESTTRVAAIVAQETAHNLGLEHVSASDDLMFPTITQIDQSFRDTCLDVLTADYDDAYVCPDVHALDCPTGAGAQQNSHAELLRLLGPRDPDAAAPVIVSVSPEDSATIAFDQTVAIVARVAGGSGDVGVRWTWVEGPAQPVAPGPGITRCTNDVCELGYERDKPIDSDWDFLELSAPPIGSYVFRLEVGDAHGHLETREIAFEVAEPTASDPESESESESERIDLRRRRSRSG